MNYLSNPKKLIEWLSNSGNYPGDGRLYVKSDEKSITKDTLCWPGVVEDIELSDEEYEEMEAWIEENDFRAFLGKEQLEDIISNLAQQLEEYSEIQLIDAVNFYWLNDAFIDTNRA